ncbi:MAG: abortive infection family protein [Prevotellaceae bacterium]|jgi:hypothetical protein|nr:abortive infection family protein [Prevotellaceae bacterium]
MEDKDITNIRKILQSRNRSDLSDLLRLSRSRLDESSTYGHYLYSTLSTFLIFSPLKQNAHLSQLSKEDEKEIEKAVLLIYPHQAEAPEITSIEYHVDFESDEIELVETNNLKRINFDYIHEQIKKCENKITDNDFEGAVTNSRTLLESICLFIYEKKKNEEYDNKGDLIKLYKEVSKILKMNPADYTDDCLKQILSGIISIINGISTLRNDFSDAHGRSPQKSYKIDERHARLSVNLAKSIAEYLFLSYEKSDNKN